MSAEPLPPPPDGPPSVRAPGLLRPAVATDADAVATVLIDSRRAFLPFAPSAHPEDDVRRWVREELIPDQRVMVWDVAGQVVGVLAVSRPGPEAWIRQLFLRPGWTGQGIGARMLAWAQLELVPPVRLWTFQANAGARRFYERHGWRAVSFTDGEDNEERCPDVLYQWDGAV